MTCDGNEPAAKVTRPTLGWQGGRADSWSGHHLVAAAVRSTVDPAALVRSQATRRSVERRLRAVDLAMRTVALPGQHTIAVTDEGNGLLVEPISPTIGSIIHGVNLAALTPSQISVAKRVFLQRRVIFFRGQGHLTDAQHIDVAAKFGECGLPYGESPTLSPHDSATTGHQTAREDPRVPPELLIFSTDATDAYVPATWHSDATWAARPPLGSILLARQVPKVGGDTIFLDTAAAWQGLSPALKQQLSKLQATHGRPHGDSEGDWKGGAVKSYTTVRRSELRSMREVQHPVMRTHPETGEAHLFVNPTFTLGLDGMPAAKSEALLNQLYTKLYSTPEYVCRFHWEAGSVAFWDNRACQHYACGDFWPQKRLMQRVTVLDPDLARRIPF